MKVTVLVSCLVSMMLVSVLASAEEGSGSTGTKPGSGHEFSLTGTIGDGAYFIDDKVYRGPVSLEVVPSVGWTWFAADFGVSTTLESIKIAGSHVGNWNTTFRPGARFTPPVTPLYLRAAVPLQVQRDNVDYGLMFGVGADFKLLNTIGLVVEADTTLSKDLEWGGKGVPVEFRAGLSFHF
jgi:hypothetical protein